MLVAVVAATEAVAAIEETVESAEPVVTVVTVVVLVVASDGGVVASNVPVYFTPSASAPSMSRVLITSLRLGVGWVRRGRTGEWMSR